MKTVIIIPARFKSTRFPGKPLVPLLGKPMILWVAEICAEALPIECVFVATDDQKIKKVVETAGFNVLMTSEKALTGTDRIAEAARQISADIIINVQGDEPLLDPNDIISIINAKKKYPDEVINGYCEINKSEDANSLNIPKVVFNEQGQMVYISRKLIPGSKSENYHPTSYHKQVCIYAFNQKELKRYSAFGRKSALELYEDIEILRFFDLDIKIRLVETTNFSLAVDVPKDVLRVEEALRSQNKI